MWNSNLKSPWLSTLAWKIPFIGELIRKNSLQRFSLSLSTLLTCGFDNSHSLTIAAGELRNILLEKRILNSLVNRLNDPDALFTIPRELSIFPPVIMQMAQDDRLSGRQSEFFRKLSNFYQNEVEAAMNAFAILAAPLFVTIFGLLGLGMLVSLYFPL